MKKDQYFLIFQVIKKTYIIFQKYKKNIHIYDLLMLFINQFFC